ncbi:MAG: hypothetical protein ABI625_15285 [bacterium]
MHLRDADEIMRLAAETPATFVVFDFLRDVRTSLAARQWSFGPSLSAGDFPNLASRDRRLARCC